MLEVVDVISINICFIISGDIPPGHIAVDDLAFLIGDVTIAKFIFASMSCWFVEFSENHCSYVRVDRFFGAFGRILLKKIINVFFFLFKFKFWMNFHRFCEVELNFAVC